MNWLSEIIIEFIQDCLSQGMKLFGSFINNMFLTVVKTSYAVVPSKVFYLFTYLGYTFLGVNVARIMYSNYISQTSGDPDQEPLDYVYKTAIAVAIISCNTWIYDILMELGSNLIDDVISKVAETDFTANMNSIIEFVLSAASGNKIMLVMVMLLVVLIGTVVFLVQTAKRGAELVLMKILLPIFACDYVSNGKERWNTFIIRYVLNFVTFSVQILCFSLFVAMFTTGIFTSDAESITVQGLIALGWLLVTLCTPNWLKEYVYSSGVNANPGTLSMVLNTLRRR